MSYEGYYQLICKNGHYDTPGCYDIIDFREDVCLICKEKFIWCNCVDETNGSFDTDDNGREVRIDGFVELEEAGFEDIWERDHYGNEYAKKRLIYKIPEKEGHKIE